MAEGWRHRGAAALRYALRRHIPGGGHRLQRRCGCRQWDVIGAASNAADHGGDGGGGDCGHSTAAAESMLVLLRQRGGDFIRPFGTTERWIPGQDAAALEFDLPNLSLGNYEVCAVIVDDMCRQWSVLGFDYLRWTRFDVAMVS